MGTARVKVPQGVTEVTESGSKSNEDTETTLLTPEADLAIEMSVTPTPERNEGVTYTIIVTNKGPSRAKGRVKIEDRFPALLYRPPEAEPLASTPCADPKTALCDIVNLNLSPGGEATYTITGTIQMDQITYPGPLFNLASVTARDFLDPDLSNNTSLLANALVGDPPISGAMAVSGHFVPGGEVVYRVALSNSDGVDWEVPGPEFTDALPDGLTLKYAGSSTGKITVDIGEDTVSWDGLIPQGEVVEIVIFARIQGEVGDTIVNQGEVAFDSDGNGNDVTHDPYRPGSEPTTLMVKRPGG
jgi:uncharacterized repeat protein (TIGR01451 family)